MNRDALVRSGSPVASIGVRNLSRLVAASVVVAALGAESLPAGPLELLSEHTWGGPEAIFSPREQAEGVAVAPDGSVYLIGQTPNFGTGASDGTSDIFLLKYAPDGALEWQRTYGVGDFNDFGFDVDVAPDGSVWITGQVLFSFALAQFDPTGTLLSERTFPTVAFPRAIDIAGDGSIYVTGGASSGGAFVMKLGPDGTVAWVTTWGPANGFAGGVDVAAAPDGSVSIVGDTNGFGANGAFVVNFDADGNVVWERTYDLGVQNFVVASGVASGPDGSVYFTGEATVVGDFLNALVVKFAADGSVLWEGTWQQKDTSSATDIAVAADGDVYITGRATRFGKDPTEDTDAFVARFRSDGKGLGAATWGGIDAPQGALAIAIAPDGSLRVAGGTDGPPPFELRNAKKTMKTPVSVVGTPMGVVTTPDAPAMDLEGTVLIPDGSQTYAGGTDAFLLTIAP